MRSLARWVRHLRKRPITTAGRPASSTYAPSWTDYDSASASSAGDGLGFVLNGDGIVCIDLDGCLDGSTVAPWAATLLEALPATYIERSPSGCGLHVWGRGKVKRGRVVRVDGGHFEVYGSGRYLTVTAQRFGSAPSRLASLGAFIGSL